MRDTWRACAREEDPLRLYKKQQRRQQGFFLPRISVHSSDFRPVQFESVPETKRLWIKELEEI
jgi:hypothetical protein